MVRGVSSPLRPLLEDALEKVTDAELDTVGADLTAATTKLSALDPVKTLEDGLRRQIADLAGTSQDIKAKSVLPRRIRSTPLESMTVSTTTPGGISSINNPAQEAVQGTNHGMAHQRSTTNEHLEQARQMLDKVSAASVFANQTGTGTGLAADTKAVGAETMVALL